MPDNAMAFYPRHFTESVENSSETYNYYDWNEKSRASAAQNVKTDTRVQPRPQGPIDTVKLTYLPPPGGIILFSGAQLHETVENTTDLARYSIDFRTLHVDDARQKQGAPNIDSRCTGTTMRDYVRAADLATMPDDVVSLYDDETASGDRILNFGDRMAKAGTESGATGS
jgi:hypothetical protein